MPSCSAFGCTNRSTQGYLMKVFPRNPLRRALWAAKVKRKDWFPNDHSYLCEVHFDNTQWKPATSKGKRRLKDTAVPTIFCFTSKQSNDQLSSESQTSMTKTNNSQLLLQNESYILSNQDESFLNKSLVNSKTDNNDLFEDYSSSVPESELDTSDKEQIKIHNQCHILEIIKNYSDSEKINALEKCVRNLENELKIAKKDIIHKDERIQMFKKKLRKARAEKKHIEITDYEKMIRSIFNDDQIAALYRKSTNYMKWCNNTIEKAIQIKNVCGVDGYHLIRNSIPLPSIRTLQRHLERLKKYPDNKDDILSCSEDNSD